VDESIPTAIRKLAELWEAKKLGRALPAWSAIDAFDLRPWLGNIEIIDVIREPFLRLRFRLVGTNITKIDGTDLTGTYAEDFFTGELAGILDEYRRVVETGEPILYWRFEHANAKGFQAWYDKAIFPLAEDGWTVDRLMIYVAESEEDEATAGH